MKHLTIAFIILAIPSVARAQQAEVVEYYAQDAIGSIRVVFDVNGAVKARQDYEPFGRPLFPAAAAPRENFGAQEKDDETDEAYFHARMFESRTGRFTRVDPIFAGLFKPQGWNRYAYALNNPQTLVDPDGQMVMEVCEKWVINDHSTYFCNTADTGIPSSWRSSGDSLEGQRDHPPAQPPTTTTPTDNHDDHGDDPRDDPHDDCRSFAETLTQATLVKGGLAHGDALMPLAMANPWYTGPNRKMENTSGFRTSLINHNQGNDAYHHIVFTVGATYSYPGAAFILLGTDILQVASMFRAESITEIRDDLAGMAVAAALGYGAVSGNISRTEKIIIKTLCK